MKLCHFFLLVVLLVVICGSASAQETPRSAKDQFEDFERSFTQGGGVQVNINPKQPGLPKIPIKVTETSPTPDIPTTTKRPAKPNKPNKQSSTNGKQSANVIKPTTDVKPNSLQPTKDSGTGLPGMKIWLERQIKCTGSFLLVSPISIFNTGDCVRAHFRLNFEGYLTIVNVGSSGSIEKIFPLEQQDNKIPPKSDNIIPDNKGWEFYEQAGNENLFFIVSNLPLNEAIFREIERQRDVRMQNSSELEVYDRDLKPRTENNEVFVLANQTRLEKPLIFRLALKHR